jgi:hypothetical protein
MGDTVQLHHIGDAYHMHVRQAAAAVPAAAAAARPFEVKGKMPPPHGPAA